LRRIGQPQQAGKSIKPDDPVHEGVQQGIGINGEGSEGDKGERKQASTKPRLPERSS
jgi:hypothetical protein